MAESYLDELVQKIVTRCDLSGFEALSTAIQDATKKARSLSRALNRAITPEQRLEMEKLKLAQREMNATTALHRVELERERNAVSSNRLELARLTLEQHKNINATKLAYAATATQLSQDKIRLAQIRKEIAEQRRLNRERMRGGFGLGSRVGAYIGAYFGLHTIKNLIDTGSRIQLVQKSIEGLTKSTQDWQYIQQQAFRTGTDIEVVAKGYRNFYSSAKMAGFDKGSIQGMYGDVLLSTRAIGATTQQTEGALLALEQMISKGTVSMEELRRQLGNALPGAFEIGAKAMNMTTMEFNQFVRKGQLASAVFVPRFIKTLKETYASGFKDIEQTVSVASIRLGNSWKLLQANFISGESGKAFAQGLNELRELLDSPEFKQFVQIISHVFILTVRLMRFAIKHIGIITVLLGYKGLYGLLVKIVGTNRLWNKILFTSITSFKALGKVGMYVLVGLRRLLNSFAFKLFGVFVLVSAIVDIIGGIGQHFWGWKVHTELGDMLDAIDSAKSMRDMDITQNAILPPDIRKNLDRVMANPNLRKKYEKALEEGRTNDAINYMKYGSQPMYMTNPTGYEKTQNVSINVNIDATNMNPEQAKVAFADTISNLLIGQDIT